MIDLITVEEGQTLTAYGGYPEWAAVRELEGTAARAVRRPNGHTVLMVTSTSHGGGVAEMMPVIVSLLRQLGVRTEQAVIRPHDRRFFPLTKRLHNLLHGAGEPNLGPEDRALYESVSRRLADEFRSWVAPEDLLVINDPQPLGMGAIIRKEFGVKVVWRSHIGLREETRATREAWEFLIPWLGAYDRIVFSLGSTCLVPLGEGGHHIPDDRSDRPQEPRALHTRADRHPHERRARRQHSPQPESLVRRTGAAPAAWRVVRTGHASRGL